MLAFGRDGMLQRGRDRERRGLCAEPLDQRRRCPGRQERRAGQGGVRGELRRLSRRGRQGQDRGRCAQPDRQFWTYGGDEQSIYSDVWGGLQGQMPSLGGQAVAGRAQNPRALSPRSQEAPAMIAARLRGRWTMGMIVARGAARRGGRQRASALRRRDVAARLRCPCAAGRGRCEQRFVQRGDVRLFRSQTMSADHSGGHASPATRQSARPSLRTGRRAPVAGGRMARSRGAAGRRACSTAWCVFLVSAAIVGGLVRPWLGLHPVSRLRRLHGRRSASRRRPLREEPAARGRYARSLAGMIFVRPAAGGQMLFTGVLLCGLMLLWMRAAVIIYALFFGLLPFPGSAYRGGAVHHADRLGDADRRQRRRRACSRPSLSPSAPSRCR